MIGFTSSMGIIIIRLILDQFTNNKIVDEKMDNWKNNNKNAAFKRLDIVKELLLLCLYCYQNR